MSQINIVLFEPEIPQNTGNIARTCAVTGCTLHLIEPLGFTVTDSRLKRAGLDYWKHLDIRYYPNIDAFFAQNADGRCFFFTKKAQRRFTDVSYAGTCYLVFGKETKGLPEPLLRERADDCVRIPMREGERCLNLSNSVAVGVYQGRDSYSLRFTWYSDPEQRSESHNVKLEDIQRVLTDKGLL